MKRISFSIVAVLISAAALFGQKWDICLNLEKGREYRIRMHTTSFMQQKLMGLAVDLDYVLYMGFNVIDVSEDMYTIEVKYHQMDMSIKLGSGEKMVASSDDSAPDIGVNSVMKELKKEGFIIKINRRGEIKEIENPEAFLDRILANAKGFDKKMDAQMRSRIDPKSFKDYFGLLFSIYPEKLVDVGDKWEISFNNNFFLNQTVKTVYELKDVDASGYRILGESEVVIDFSKEEEMYADVKFSDTKMDIVSEFKLDRETGWIKSGVFDQNISGRMEFEQDDGTSISMDMELKSITRIEME